MKIDFKEIIKKLGLDSLEITLWSKKDTDAGDAPSSDAKQSAAPHPALDKLSSGLSTFFNQTQGNTASSSLLKPLIGGIGSLGDYYFPTDMLGGACPLIAGEEESIVWNAAAEACDSERVHVVWQSFEGRLWYLAVRSNELTEHPGSWCPFASLLPGMKDATPMPVCYTYYSEETATMMVVEPNGLSIYRGTTLVVRAKAERTARELGDVPIVDLEPDRIMQLAPTPWYSLSLFEERARRILATVSVLAAISLASFSFVVWLLASMSLVTTKHDIAAAQERSKTKTMDLMTLVQKLHKSPLHDQLAAFSDLNDALLNVNGFLEVYEIINNRPRWRAIVPANVTADRISEMGGKNIETVPTGIAIGNAAEIEYEAIQGGRK